MIRVGLTGNIGSGKTTVAKVFETLGAGVFYADNEARLMLNDAGILSKLIGRFGKQVVGSDQKIDRQALAEIIFRNKDALQFVNNLIHPAVRKRFDEFCNQNLHFKLFIYEAAILIETGYYKNLDKTILVTAPENIRLQRVIQRDKVSPEIVLQRMRNQWAEDRKLPFADFIVVNDNKSPILEQCDKIYTELLKTHNK